LALVYRARPMAFDLIGVDFSSRPRARKPIVVALGQRDGGRVSLHGFERFATLESICEYLECQPGDILSYRKDEDSAEVPAKMARDSG